MGFRPILPVRQPITISTMLNFDGDGDGIGDGVGMCKQALRNVMDQTEKIHKQVRQEEVNRLESNSLRETTIAEEAINEVCFSDEVNFMSSGRGDSHFNSTMKNNGEHWDNSPRGRNNSYNSYNSRRNNSYSSNNKNWNLMNNYCNNYDSRRRLKRYTHVPRQPKNGIE